jgi:hypothetical protein
MYEAKTVKCYFIEQKYVAICFKRFFPHIRYSYAYALEQIKLHTLHKRRYHINALLFIQVYVGSKLGPFLLETVGLQVPAWYIRDVFVQRLLFKHKLSC